ncbi:MAG: VacJ family lipoprotein [Sideroxydans sp.]|nr:VacJ family lipoprotein [Sideroxydans sp.]
MTKPELLSRSTLLLSCLLFSACSTTHLSRYTQEKDPFESYNRIAYSFNDALDKAILKPVAQGYANYMPQLGKMATENFFSNLDDVTVTCNDVLQLKFRQAASDGSRVLFNTTFGLFGLINVTTRLPKHDEDFGQTLGYWGMPSGPYVVIPFLGPSSVRDGTGLYVDSFVSAIGTTQHVPTRNAAYVVDGIVSRAGLLDDEKILENAAIDRYSSMRDAYLMRRRSLVYDGNPPRQKYEDFDEE